MLAPHEVLRYVAVHEVCHLLEPNHQPPFWALVDRMLPGWRAQRLWLRRHGSELASDPQSKPTFPHTAKPWAKAASSAPRRSSRGRRRTPSLQRTRSRRVLAEPVIAQLVAAILHARRARVCSSLSTVSTEPGSRSSRRRRSQAVGARASARMLDRRPGAEPAHGQP